MLVWRRRSQVGRRANSLLFGVCNSGFGISFGFGIHSGLFVVGPTTGSVGTSFGGWMVGVCSCSCHRSLRISSFSLRVYAPLQPCERFVSAHLCIYKRSQEGTVVVYKSIRSTCCWWCWTPVLTFTLIFAFIFIFAFASEKKIVF